MLYEYHDELFGRNMTMVSLRYSLCNDKLKNAFDYENKV